MGVVKLAAAQDGADSSDVCDDPEIVKLMIEYLYLFDYNTQLSKETSASVLASSSPYAESYLIEHAKVFAMAVEYQADRLRQLAAKTSRKQLLFIGTTKTSFKLPTWYMIRLPMMYKTCAEP